MLSTARLLSMLPLQRQITERGHAQCPCLTLSSHLACGIEASTMRFGITGIVCSRRLYPLVLFNKAGTSAFVYLSGRVLCRCRVLQFTRPILKFTSWYRKPRQAVFRHPPPDVNGSFPHDSNESDEVTTTSRRTATCRGHCRGEAKLDQLIVFRSFVTRRSIFARLRETSSK